MLAVTVSAPAEPALFGEMTVLAMPTASVRWVTGVKAAKPAWLVKLTTALGSRAPVKSLAITVRVAGLVALMDSAAVHL